MPKRLPVHGLDPEGNPDGKVVGLSGGKATWVDGGGSGFGGLPEIDIVTDFGAAVDGDGSGGGTDDSAAVQDALDAAGAAGGARIISSRLGICNIAGALQDTGGANAQLLLPTVDYGDSECVPVVIEGGLPPGSVVAVGSTTPLAKHQLVFQSFLTSGSGGALLGGQGPGGTSELFTNVDLYLRNATFRMPSNPVLSALNLLKVACADLDNVIVDAGSYSIPSISVPTTSTSYAIKLPDLDNGAHTRLQRVDVVGFYNGLLYNEHTLGDYVAAWACKIAHTFAAGYHASKFLRMAYYHCQTGIKGVGAHYVDIDQLNIEHAASGTWAPAYDIDDASNYLHAYIRKHVVKATVGVDTTFTINGGSHVSADWVGDSPGSGVPTTRLVSAGTGLTGGGDLAADRTLAIDTSAEAERVRDTMGTALVAGTNVTITVDDPGDTITIAASATAATALRPLTTESGGLPDFVWDDNNELVMTEAPG